MLKCEAFSKTMKPSLLTSTQEHKPNASNVFIKCKLKRLRNLCTVNFGGWRFLLERYWPFRWHEAHRKPSCLYYSTTEALLQNPVSSDSSKAIKRISDCYREGRLISCSWNDSFLFCQLLHNVENIYFYFISIIYFYFCHLVGWCLTACVWIV